MSSTPRTPRTCSAAARGVVLLATPLTLLALASLSLGAQAPRTLVLRGGTVHTAAGEAIRNGLVVVRGGKIVAVGANIPVPENADVVDVTGKDVIPGMIDNHSHIGADPEDLNESAASYAPQNRMVDVLRTEDPSWTAAVNGGVTTVVTGPGSGEVTSGVAAVVKTFGTDMQSRILLANGGLKIAMGHKGNQNRPPNTSMAVTAGLRALFVRTKEYMDQWQRWESGGKTGAPPARDLGLENVARVLRHEDYVRAHVHSAADILAVLHLKDEFGFDLAVHHATEAYKVADEIAKRHVGVVGMPLFVRIGMKEEIMRSPYTLWKAGALYAFHTDDPVVQTKWLRYCAAMGMRYGLPEEEALKGVTINAATIARVANRVGSIEPGKDADIVVLDGPWYEPKTRVDRVYVDGRLAYDRTKEDK
ncbi:MAG: amidohydrolase family protein [Gemmatimonadota bacterium]|nr:amidohydrolase family protein [Gemmatimonadota bacterium]